MDAKELLTILPALVLLAAGLLVVLVDMTAAAPNGRKAAVEWIAYLGVIGSFFCVYWQMNTAPIDAFYHSIVVDRLARFSALTVLAATLLTIVLSVDYVVARGIYLAEYVALVLLASAGMMFLAMSADLITMFLSIEILSIAIYVLCGILRRDGRANEAAIKYFVQGAFATAFLLYGMALLYGATGSVHLHKIGSVLEHGTSPLAMAGMGLMLAGFAFKIGAAPFHLWVPDVYEGAPTAVTAFMSVAVKAAAFAALVRLLHGSLDGAKATWQPVVVGLAALTMIAGNLGAVAQKSVKRMLAYSSVAHTGYALVGIAAGGESGGSSALFYLFAYTFMTLGAFAMLMFAGKDGKDGKDAETFDDLAGLGKRRPYAALFMTIFMVSLAGIPPTAGFFGKFMLFQAAVLADQVPLAVLGVLLSIVGAYYYLRVVVAMWMREPVEAPVEEGAPEVAKFDFNVGVAVLVAALLTVAFGVWPSQYVNMAKNAVTDAKALVEPNR